MSNGMAKKKKRIEEPGTPAPAGDPQEKPPIHEPPAGPPQEDPPDREAPIDEPDRQPPAQDPEPENEDVERGA
jgi:hypothetical protein